MSDRFELENQITNLYSVCDDLDLLSKNVLESELSTDDIANALIGVSVLLRLRQNQLFDTMKQIFHLDEYNEPC